MRIFYNCCRTLILRLRNLLKYSVRFKKKIKGKKKRGGGRAGRREGEKEEGRNHICINHCETAKISEILKAARRRKEGQGGRKENVRHRILDKSIETK